MTADRRALLDDLARPSSSTAHGRGVPEAPLRVELTGPEGQVWTSGPDGCPDVVRGPALDSCLLVTQRRHRDDLDLEVPGRLAQPWAALAQAFAGPPGSGRPPRATTRQPGVPGVGAVLHVAAGQQVKTRSGPAAAHHDPGGTRAP